MKYLQISVILAKNCNLQHNNYLIKLKFLKIINTINNVHITII